jgi:hypothetical protein
VVVVGGVVVDVVDAPPDVPVPTPATVLAGAGGFVTDTTAKTAPDDADEPEPEVGDGVASAASPLPPDAPPCGGDCEGVKFGTSLGPGPGDCAETRGWMIGPGPNTRPATTEPAAAAAATDAMKGFRGRKPGRA